MSVEPRETDLVLHLIVTGLLLQLQDEFVALCESTAAIALAKCATLPLPAEQVLSRGR
jgi:hypothetical protein